MKHLLLLGFLLTLCMSDASFAATRENTRCSPSPRTGLGSDTEPSVIGLTNNLRRKVGAAETASGTPIILEGTLLDTRCVPISDARIEVWQADSEGNFPDDEDATDTSQYFVGSGTSFTNNMGQFTFLTVMPGAAVNRAPYIHVRITHPDFKSLDTDIFMNPEALSTDPVLQKHVASGSRDALVAEVGKREQGQTIYRIKLVLSGGESYRQK